MSQRMSWTARITAGCPRTRQAVVAVWVLVLLAIAAAPGYAQQPPVCTAPSWTVGEETVLPPWEDRVSGGFGGKIFTKSASGLRSFDGRFQARAATLTGLDILACFDLGQCTKEATLAFLVDLLGWENESFAELARRLDLTLNAPTGAEAEIRVSATLDGLMAVAAVGIADASASLLAHLTATPSGQATSTLFGNYRRYDNLSILQLEQGVYFRRVAEAPLPSTFTMAAGDRLRLEGHLNTESTSRRVAGYGASIGVSQFNDPVGGPLLDLLGLSIPEPGLKVRATIVNVTPVLSRTHSSVIVNLGEAVTNTGTLCDGDGNTVTLSASIGHATNNGNGTWSWSLPAGAFFHEQRVTITADDNHGGTGVVTFDLVPRLSIDIKPKTPRNLIDLRSTDSVPVAILARPGFDPIAEVDRTTLRFGATGNEDSVLRTDDTQKSACGGFDVNADGAWDLVCNFVVSRTGFYCGQGTGILKARVPAFGSEPAEARDSVRLLPCEGIQVPTVIHEGAPLEASVNGVAVSPDGQTLYLAGRDAIYRMPASGGMPTPITVGAFGSPLGLAVSPDGNTIFATVRIGPIAASNPVVVSVPASGGAATVVANLPVGSSPNGLTVTRDGSRLLVPLSDTGRTLLSVPLSGGPVEDLFRGTGPEQLFDIAISSTGETAYMGGHHYVVTASAAGGEPRFLHTGVFWQSPETVALAPDDSTLFVLDRSIRVDPQGNVVESGGAVGAVFAGPSEGGTYWPVVIGGRDFSLSGTFAVSPDGAFLYLGGSRRTGLTPVILRVDLP